jgi:hypothetical protein
MNLFQTLAVTKVNFQKASGYQPTGDQKYRDEEVVPHQALAPAATENVEKRQASHSNSYEI